ncbi:MAG: hypothetical protein KME28_21555 [Pelatocladus maniniholoensis HA4357-MV3]|jgi:hypothetical protein|uniref:Uncharacterized protein n=1 Tax=Pelatocladus maniniholoensis HA4357-MV3 TaxID=1117104 RepID=A0A9E3HBT1_9NOST|nr:hypothetical protein [Pelatocladus maniniholoensis HA4357-MV3]BAZ68584.1 hypothetical protein NIES4106_33480 [Fischerella sp. NIES-4106]
MPNIPLWQKILFGALGLILLTFSGVKTSELFADSKTPEPKPTTVSPVPPSPVPPSISPSPDQKDFGIHVWTGENRESVADVEVEFSLSIGSSVTSKTGTDGYASIQIPSKLNVQRVILRKKGFKTAIYTINPIINNGKTIEYELKPDLRQSLVSPPLPSPTSYISPSPLPNPSSKSQSSYQKSPPPLPTPFPTFTSPPSQVSSPTEKVLKSSYKNAELALLDGYTIEIFF